MLRDAWALAIEALYQIEVKGLNERLGLIEASMRLGSQDAGTRGLAHKLVIETCRRRNLIDHIINIAAHSNNVTDFSPKVRVFLRLFTGETKIWGNDSYEMGVKIARVGRSILGWKRLHHAEYVLGPILGLNLESTLKGLGELRRVSLRVSQPERFVKYCFRLLGRNEALKFLESTLSNISTYIRVNTLKMDESKIQRKLESEGVVLQKIEGLQYTYEVIESKRALVRTPSFRNGLFYIQDKASCLATEVADPKAGMTVLDVCAAPGAKTSFLAQLMENKGRIYSIDYSRRRTKIWEKEIQRMNVKNAEPIICDTCNLSSLQVSADLVTLDPPCTSTGAFSRTPSAKWRLAPRSIRNMSTLQWKMLSECSQLVKRGGSLVYSTCSVTLEENEFLIERILRHNLDFKLVETHPRIGLPGLRGLSECQRLFPHIHECNGFFVAKLERCS